MIEATCSACGTLNRVSEANVPGGAKFITCADCKSRIAISQAVPPPIPKLPPIPSAARTTGVLDLPDLPAPKRTSALGPLPGSTGRAAPAAVLPPRTGLASAIDPELPAPKVMRAPHAVASPLGFDDPAAPGGIDLPAPKRAVPRPLFDAAPDGGDLAAPRSDRVEADLLAPKPNSRRTSIDVEPRGRGRDPKDLRAGGNEPGARRGPMISDLPAPRAADASTRAPVPEVGPPGALFDDLPHPRSAAAMDLPQPKRFSDDLPRPKPQLAPAPKNFFDPPPRSAATARVPEPKAQSAPEAPAPKNFLDDLPQPRSAAAARRPQPKAQSAPEAPEPENFFDNLPQPKAQSAADLPAPKSFFDDLPAPKAQSAVTPKNFGDDLSQPRSSAAANLSRPKAPIVSEAPEPRSFFDDLPQPRTQNTPDLPAPKGFFDDLPQPRTQNTPDLPAPKGFFDDIPGLPSTNKPDLPAPKGFFDDLPQPKTSSAADVPAPKGFFDDIPGLPSTNKPDLPAPKGFFDDLPQPKTHPSSAADVPAPKGFFDDIPGLPSTSKPDLPAPKGFFDDLPGRPGATVNPGAAKELFDDRPPPSRAEGSPPPSSADAGGGLELLAPPDDARSFDDLDLSRPAAAPVRFDAPPAAVPPGPPLVAPRASDAGPVLELEGAAPMPAPRPVARRITPTSLVGPKSAVARRRQRMMLIGALAGTLALGGGGLFLYRHHLAEVERQAAITEQLALARRAHAASDPKHWQSAATAARNVLALEPSHLDALGIAAESLLASAMIDGTGAAAKLTQARALLDTANNHGLSSPLLTRARALAAITAHQPDRAIPILQPAPSQPVSDPTLALYLGWALADKGDADAAIQAFDRAATAEPLKLAAVYGRGNARLARADLDGARGDFQAVLDLAKDHIGAQVGLAAAMPPAKAQQRESDLMAILARKDIASADPRAVTLAWSLAGDAAMRAGRYDVARERFHKALAVAPHDLAATAGLAETELRDGKIAAAAELTSQALTASKDNVAAQLVQSEIEIKQNRLPLASQRLGALGARVPPLLPLEQARLYLVTGKLREAQGKGDEAAESYIAGARAARALDLEPMVAAVSKLSSLTQAAVAEHDQPRADALRTRTDELLGDFAEQAARDPQLALMLGIGYLEAGNPDKAEPWLRHAAQAHPKDPEARFQLGRALLRAGRADAALEALHEALALDPERADIGGDLAHAYEALGRDADAAALYRKLLAARDPSIELRARGGRFLARIGAIPEAAAQGAKILEVDPRNPTGQYLKGEGLLAGGKREEARQYFQHAISVDRDPQYLEALGRAAEALARDGDRAAGDLALLSYTEALKAAPDLLPALIGQGRIFVSRHEAAQAVPPLVAAARRLPQNADLMFLLGAAYQDLGKPAVAREWLDRAARTAPGAEVYWRLAQLDRDANRAAQAVAELDRATRLATEDEQRTGTPVAWLTDAFYQLGQLQLDLRNEPAARDAWQVYVKRGPPPSAQLTEVKQQLLTTLRP